MFDADAPLREGPPLGGGGRAVVFPGGTAVVARGGSVGGVTVSGGSVAVAVRRAATVRLGVPVARLAVPDRVRVAVGSPRCSSSKAATSTRHLASASASLNATAVAFGSAVCAVLLPPATEIASVPGAKKAAGNATAPTPLVQLNADRASTDEAALAIGSVRHVPLDAVTFVPTTKAEDDDAATGAANGRVVEPPPRAHPVPISMVVPQARTSSTNADHVTPAGDRARTPRTTPRRSGAMVRDESAATRVELRTRTVAAVVLDDVPATPTTAYAPLIGVATADSRHRTRDAAIGLCCTITLSAPAAIAEMPHAAAAVSTPTADRFKEAASAATTGLNVTFRTFGPRLEAATPQAAALPVVPMMATFTLAKSRATIGVDTRFTFDRLKPSVDTATPATAAVAELPPSKTLLADPT